jgi:hypothetical protein
MHIDPSLLSAISGLAGALIGGCASLAAAMYTQRYQDRLQRVARETTKREAVYADFIMSASNLLLNARVHDEITLGGDTQHLIGLCKPNETLCSAERHRRSRGGDQGLIEISLKPSVDLRKLAMAELSRNSDSDLLLPFSLACRADLDNVYRTVH